MELNRLSYEELTALYYSMWQFRQTCGSECQASNDWHNYHSCNVALASIQRAIDSHNKAQGGTL